MRRFSSLLVAFGMVFAGSAALMVAAPNAGASYGPLAVYQIAFSQNCNNASFCLGGQGGLGGTWGWAALNSDGTGDLEVTFCGHAPGQGGGAGHEHVDVFAWSIAKHKGVFRFDAASDPSFVGPTPIPATPGHYNMHPAPGVAIEITVTKIPNR